MFTLTMWAVPVAMIGVWCFTVGLELYREARTYARRPKAKASIVSSSIDEARNGNCSVRLEYDYEVAGARHTATGTWPPTRNATRKTAEQHLAQFPPGAEMLVAYDPQQPGVAMLGGLSLKREKIFMLVGVVFAAVACAMVYFDLGYSPPPARMIESPEVEKR